MNEIVTPTFTVGGAPKAGTTSLYHYLDQHPQVCMSARKETSVFIDNRRLSWLDDNYYRHYDGEPAVGEASAGNLGDPDVPARIAEVLPNIKLIFVLRDPVERLYSHFTFLQGVQSIDRDISFSSLIRSSSEWRNTLIDLGRYYKHLTRYEEYFSRRQMLVLFFEDLTSDTSSVVERVYQFVEVDPSFQPDTGVRNRTREPQFPGLHRLLTRVWEASREHVDVYLANKMRPIRQIVKRLVTKEANRRPMSTEDRAYLQNVYQEPNRKLEEWIGRNLSHWG
jgi:hypothetical protein